MIKKLLHQDPISHLKENGLRVILLNSLLEMQDMELKQEVLLDMNVYTIAFFLKKSKKILRKHFKMLIGFYLCKKNLISMEETKYRSWYPSLKTGLS